MNFKKLFLLLAFASVLTIGCTQNVASNELSANGQQVETSTKTTSQAAVQQEDDDQPPAPPSDEEPVTAKAAVSSNEFVGLWREFSSRMFYDIGGGGAVGSGSGQPLELNSDGTWKFGVSTGKWGVEEIKEEDWTAWQVQAYGPKRKIILENWNKAIASGPVEESEGRIDFFWVIYRVEPPTVSSAGQVQIKYGHAS